MKNEFCTVEMENDIVCITFHHSIKLEENQAVEMVQLRKELTNNIPKHFILDGKNLTNVTKGARDYLASKDATDGIIAGAFLVDSPLTKILGNFFLKISKPNKPSKLFTSKEEAIEWLSTVKITK